MWWPSSSLLLPQVSRDVLCGIYNKFSVYWGGNDTVQGARMQRQETRMIAPCPAEYKGYNHSNTTTTTCKDDHLCTGPDTLVQIPDLQAPLAFHRSVL